MAELRKQSSFPMPNMRWYLRGSTFLLLYTTVRMNVTPLVSLINWNHYSSGNCWRNSGAFQNANCKLSPVPSLGTPHRPEFVFFWAVIPLSRIRISLCCVHSWTQGTCEYCSAHKWSQTEWPASAHIPSTSNRAQKEHRGQISNERHRITGTILKQMSGNELSRQPRETSR